MSKDLQYILNKYGDIIKEEVNIKEIKPYENLNIQTIYVPDGKKVSAKFGKDTGSIIKFAKMGNVEVLEGGKIKVFGDNKEWILESQDYEIRYTGDIDEKSMAIESGIVVGLDLNITEELKLEGYIREISRFLNQMRKEANYNVDDRVNLYWFSENQDFYTDLFNKFSDFLKQEVLLKQIELMNKDISCDIKKLFQSEQYGNITFCLVK